MERPIAYDKLAREDRWIRMRAREVADSEDGGNREADSPMRRRHGGALPD